MNFLNGDKIGGCVSAKFLLLGVGAVAGAVVLSRLIKEAKPVAVATTKEAIAFKQWLDSAKAESEEFVGDVVAEAKHEYRTEVEEKLAILQKQQEMLEKIKSNLK